MPYLKAQDVFFCPSDPYAKTHTFTWTLSDNLSNAWLGSGNENATPADDPLTIANPIPWHSQMKSDHFWGGYRYYASAGSEPCITPYAPCMIDDNYVRTFSGTQNTTTGNGVAQMSAMNIDMWLEDWCLHVADTQATWGTNTTSFANGYGRNCSFRDGHVKFCLGTEYLSVQ